MPTLLLVVGVPGAGKTTLVKSMTEGLSWSIEKKPFWQTIYYDQTGQPFADQFGWNPEAGDAQKFGGTDRLAYDIVPDAVARLKERPYDVIVAEGDRLTNPRFIVGAMGAGYTPEIVHVEVDARTLETRHGDRDQDIMWRLTRSTKVKGIVETYAPWVIPVSGQLPTDVMLRQLADKSKAVRRFLEAR